MARSSFGSGGTYHGLRGWRTYGLPPEVDRREQIDLSVAGAGLRDA